MEGDVLAFEGAQKAAARAEEQTEWRLEDAMAQVMNYPDDTFTIPEVRMKAEAKGFPKPPDGRAWGAVGVALAKAGKIKRLMYVKSQDPKHHSTPTTLWTKMK